MKRFKQFLMWFGVTMFLASLSLGCAGWSSSQPGSAQEVPGEVISDYVVLVYELPFVYEKGHPQQEAFFTTLREIIAPANWKKGPDRMIAVANILTVRTTAKNHMRLERFFDSIPDRPDYHPDPWNELPEEGKDK